MRVIKLKRAKNFRDLGGAKTCDGRVVKHKMLIRGPSFFRMKKFDMLTLRDEYNLKTMIDLRTFKEREEKPNRTLNGIEILNRPIFDESVFGVSREKDSEKFFTMKTLEVMPGLDKVYPTMVKGESLDRLVKIIDEILNFPEEKYSVLFHCTAGKDRTGIVAALILLFLGVSRDDVYEDYLLTNKFMKTKAVFLAVLLYVVKHNLEFSKKIKHYNLAEKEYLDAALNLLERNFGSIENFFDKKLNYSKEKIEQIKNKFLE